MAKTIWNVSVIGGCDKFDCKNLTFKMMINSKKTTGFDINAYSLTPISRISKWYNFQITAFFQEDEKFSEKTIPSQYGE